MSPWRPSRIAGVRGNPWTISGEPPWFAGSRPSSGPTWKPSDEPSRAQQPGRVGEAAWLNLAGERGEDFNFLLTRYAIERLLYRLSQSDHTGDFVLKGAMLFHLVSKQVPHRTTRDVDLLGKGTPDLPRLEKVFREIIRTRVDDDGLVFLGKGVRAERIRAEDEYAGFRLHVEARMGAARIPIQVDIGFGDAPVEALLREQAFARSWSPGGPWR